MRLSTKMNIMILMISVFFLFMTVVPDNMSPLVNLLVLPFGLLLSLVLFSVIRDRKRLDQEHHKMFKSGILFISMLLVALALCLLSRDIPKREDLPIHSGIFRSAIFKRRNFRVEIEVEDDTMTFSAASKIRPQLSEIRDGTKVKILADSGRIVECITNNNQIGDYDEYVSGYKRFVYGFAVIFAIGACAHLNYAHGPFRWRL